MLIAHGHEPAWTRNRLSSDCRAQLRAIDLHFHDFRYEAGCRWLEGGWPIHHVQEMLGHTSLAQTSTYLHAAEMGLQESMNRFDAQRGKPVANETPMEQPPLGHDADRASPKDVLH